jgi:hypothetical protein
MPPIQPMVGPNPRQLQSLSAVDWIGHHTIPRVSFAGISSTPPGGELSGTPESPISEPISSVGSGEQSGAYCTVSYTLRAHKSPDITRIAWLILRLTRRLCCPRDGTAMMEDEQTVSATHLPRDT